MKKHLLSLLILLSFASCSKVSKIYNNYKKALGLDEKGSYLLANHKPLFINSDLKVEYQVFDELSDEVLNEIDIKAIDNNAKEEKVIIDEDFSKNLAFFESERLVYAENQRMPASVKEDISSSDKLYINAQNYIKKGAFKKAELELKKYLEQDLNKTHRYSSYLNLAEIKIQDKKYLEALYYYTELLLNNYDKIDSELLYSKFHFLYTRLGKKELALNYKKKLEKYYPASSYLSHLK